MRSMDEGTRAHLRSEWLAYRLGWMAGEAAGRELTDREIAERWPWMMAADRDAAGQGSVDGAAGDKWRLRRGRVPA